MVRRVGGRPGWVYRSTAAVFVGLMLLPVLALVLALVIALGATLLVYLVLSTLAGLLPSSDPSPKPEDDGRRNVRVVPESDRP